MKLKILAFITMVAVFGVGSANAETWECEIIGACGGSTATYRSSIENAVYKVELGCW